MCIVILTLVAGLLARSLYPEGPATGHLDRGFSWFPCVYKRMLRWFPSSQVATTCLSCSPPDLNFLVTLFVCFFYVEYIYGFVGWGGLQAKSMTSQRNRAVTRWRICVTMATL